MKKQNIDAQTAAVTELYRRAADELAALNQEAEDLLNEGEMLYRGRVFRKAELVRERMRAIKDVAAIFGMDPEKSGEQEGR